jgi:predicted dehydrogenase
MVMRFGLFGTGNWAEITHGPGLVAHPDVELVGVWGRDRAKAIRLAERLGARGFADADKLIASVDAVAIALPPDVQAELAVRAANAGRHLLLDKPLALSVEAADRVVAAVERTQVATVIFFTRRFFPAVEAFLADAATQEWDGAHITMFSSLYATASPFAASPWRRERGALWDIGPHALSIVVPALGPVVEVKAVAGRHMTSHILLRHERGAVSSLALTLDAPSAAATQEVVFYGPAGRVTVREANRTGEEAFGEAISRLIANAASGVIDDSVGVRFGRDIVAILATAEAAIAASAVRVDDPQWAQGEPTAPAFSTMSRG